MLGDPLSTPKRGTMNDNFLHPETNAIRTRATPSGHREHATSIYMTSSFTFNDAEQARAMFSGEEAGNIYTRYGNPNVDEFVYWHKLVHYYCHITTLMNFVILIVSFDNNHNNKYQYSNKIIFLYHHLKVNIFLFLLPFHKMILLYYRQFLNIFLMRLYCMYLLQIHIDNPLIMVIVLKRNQPIMELYPKTMVTVQRV